MDIASFLETQRTDYLKAFESIKTRLTRNDLDLLTEPIDQDPAKNSLEPFSFFRYDFLTKTNQSDGYINTNVNVNPTVFESEQSLKFNSIEIRLQSFVWNSCKMNFDKSIKIEILNEWFIKSIQIQNENFDTTIKNVLHSLSSLNDKEIVVDFGTVKCEKLFDLFHILENAGISKIIVESVYE